MPANDTDLPESQGTESDLFAPSTADGSESTDLLGAQDAAQSSDLGSEPSPDEGDTTGEFIDDYAQDLLIQNPQRGLEYVREKVNKLIKGQHKAFTKRMSKIAKDTKEKDAVVAQYQALDARMKQLFQEDPDFVNLWVKKVKGESGDSAPKPKKPINTTSDLLSEVRSMIREEVGNLRGAYQEDKAKESVDVFLGKARNEKLNSMRNELIRVKSEHPEYTMKKVLAVVDPDLLVDLVSETRRRQTLPEGGLREMSTFTMPKKAKYGSTKEAFDAAAAEYGVPAWGLLPEGDSSSD